VWIKQIGFLQAELAIRGDQLKHARVEADDLLFQVRLQHRNIRLGCLGA
jgi:hypothetical protein